MIRYDAKRIMRKAGRSSRRIVHLFQTHVESQHTPFAKYENQVDFTGESFIANPSELITYAFKWTLKEIAQYILLASYRSYSHYEITGDKTLDLFHSPVSENTINQNRLLKVNNGRIYFYYEEVINRRNKLWH